MLQAFGYVLCPKKILLGKFTPTPGRKDKEEHKLIIYNMPQDVKLEQSQAVLILDSKRWTEEV